MESPVEDGTPGAGPDREAGLADVRRTVETLLRD